jgi:hypothetical protein
MMNMNKYPPKMDQAGSILVSIMVVTLFLTTIIFSLMILANSNLVRARSRVLSLQAQYSAESGADSAIAQLNSGNETYDPDPTAEVTVLDNNLYRATYSVTVDPGSNAKERIIRAVGRVYSPKNSGQAAFSRTIEITAQRTSTTTSSNMLSRNIIFIESGVKNIVSKDVYVNGYIALNKNTTNLIAENITVADKNTGAANCSIGGTGNLLKPSTFSNPSQTKTNITLRYNNCISPPGNTSNANFNVTPNSGNISKIGSTYIPVSQYMDETYQNAPGGCTDWTSGSFPRSIPSSGNDKRTHYPDKASSINTSCGTSGNLALSTGQYTLRDHAHIRANLCAAAACSPTFYNPDQGEAGIKFLFVEGSINFDSVQTAVGSGPIVIINYGADPAAKTSVCPLGGSVYLGSGGNTSARALYFLSLNGVCLDKTKFGSDPALGGVSGKNLFVATSPGTPFDLELDTAFPTNQIPVDLAWRATRYHRL